VPLTLTRPESASSQESFPSVALTPRAKKGRFVVGVVVLCLIFSTSAFFLVLAPNSVPESNREGPILVVGDSLVLQATNALRSWNLPSVPIIADGGLGSAPCDWENGYTDPLTSHYLKFSDVFQKTQPAAVVFAFTGNPGLESHATGCVNSSGRYSLSTLLANYKRALTEMARYASDHDAQVYISATPPRNPLTPAGAYTGSGGKQEYGFNGVQALNRLYESITRSALGRELHWAYDPYPAQYVSTAAMTWQLSERCLPWDGGTCTKGSVQVRAGGFDAIHLDTRGAGAILYAMGLVKMPLEQMRGWSPPSPLAFTLGTR
jgi:hypothetical protein